MRHGSTVAAALEDAWAAIRTRHPEVRPAVMITGRAAHASRGQYGHFHACAWIPGARGWPDLDEVFISAESIAHGGRAAMGAIMHEAAHSLAFARGIADVSPGNVRYHTRVYATHAAELGLVPPLRAAAGYGWSTDELTDKAADDYAEIIAALDSETLARTDPHVVQRNAFAAALQAQARRDVRLGRNLEPADPAKDA